MHRFGPGCSHDTMCLGQQGLGAARTVPSSINQADSGEGLLSLHLFGVGLFVSYILRECRLATLAAAVSSFGCRFCCSHGLCLAYTRWARAHTCGAWPGPLGARGSGNHFPCVLALSPAHPAWPMTPKLHPRSFEPTLK